MESPSTSAPDHRGNTGSFQKSHYQRTVCLADWWLVKAENDVQGRRLAIAGLSDRGKQAMRVFTSAPILKRYDDFTMETIDGICVLLNGFINKTRTLENGFPSDVFNHFLFGFPPYWKEYDEFFLDKEPPSEDILRDKHLEQLAQQLGCAQPHVDSCEQNFESQGKIEATDRRKSKRAKSLVVALPQRCSFSGFQKESYIGGTSVEDHTAPKLPVNSLENEDTGIREIKTRSKTQKAKNKAMESPCTLAASTKSHHAPETVVTGNNSLSEKAKAKDLDLETVQKSAPVSKAKNKATESPCTLAASTKSHHAPETVVTGNNSLSEKAKVKYMDLETLQKSAPVSKKIPKSKKETGWSPSPESQSFNRSRSGRLLMPTLEYWRNQRAIYNADRTITGIEEGMYP